EAFKKTNAAYMLAMHAYLELSQIRHPNLRYRKTVKDSLDTLLMQAKLLTIYHHNEPVSMDKQDELKAYLQTEAKTSNSLAIETVKRKADEKPGKQLSNLLIEFTDYEVTQKKAGKKHHKSTAEAALKSHHEPLKRKASEPEETGHAASLKKKISTSIKRKVSEAETIIKKKSGESLSFLHKPSLEKSKSKKNTKKTSDIYRQPSNEKAKRVLGITDVFDDPLSMSSSTTQKTPVKRHRHQVIKSKDASDSQSYESIALSSGGTPPKSGETKRRHAIRSSDASGSPHSPRFWKRTVRPAIDKVSRSKSSMSLPRQKI
ncbi:MAG TPA: hypothetical protein VFU82_05030, partial [Gammaproteobacteria bacterium]|nr:hypothetical protein [Gammaproteobacteria bacterium]